MRTNWWLDLFLRNGEIVRLEMGDQAEADDHLDTLDSDEPEWFGMRVVAGVVVDPLERARFSRSWSGAIFDRSAVHWTSGQSKRLARDYTPRQATPQSIAKKEAA